MYVLTYFVRIYLYLVTFHELTTKYKCMSKSRVKTDFILRLVPLSRLGSGTNFKLTVNKDMRHEYWIQDACSLENLDFDGTHF